MIGDREDEFVEEVIEVIEFAVGYAAARQDHALLVEPFAPARSPVGRPPGPRLRAVTRRQELV